MTGAHLLDKPTANVPGTTFNYCSTNTQRMSEMASKASGRPLDEYAAELLFGPIGIRDYFWKDAPEGFKDAGLGAWMALLSERARRRADDLAREVAHLSLADHPQFQRMFIGAIRFPEAID